MSCVADWFALLVALAAAVVSVISLLLSKRHAEDFTAGSHAIAYREHVWFLYNQGLSEAQIEQILRRETYRSDLPLAMGNAYDGANGEGGLCREIGSVAEILGPSGQRCAPERRPSAAAPGEPS